MSSGKAYKPSPAQLKALSLAAQGRVQYGSEFPRMARRADARGEPDCMRTWLVDDATVYGNEHATWRVLEERGWIRVRHDLLPHKRVEEQVKQYTSITGSVTTRVLPARDVPEDPGWRAKVELTDTGRELLEQHGVGPVA